VSAASPVALQLVAPRAGTLSVVVRQSGISVAASLSGGAQGTASVSPFDRYGTLTLVADSLKPESVSVRIVSRDSADIVGEACVSAYLVSEADRARLAAERAFGDAGRATQTRHWREAFENYAKAARGFDHIDRQRAAEARGAMAQLAYRQLDRNRDSYALAVRALADLEPGTRPGLRSALVELQATIAAEATDESAQLRRAHVVRLLDSAKTLAIHARFGERELPRLTILRGFLEYALNNTSMARSLFEDAARQCQALHDWECYARARQNFAELIEETGNNQEALRDYADAIQFLSPSVAPELTADISDNLGRLQASGGNFTRAEKSYLNATRLYAQIDECDGVRRVLAHLGTLLVDVGSVADASVYLQRAASRACPALMALSSVDRSDAQGEAARIFSLESAADAADASCRAPIAAETLTADARFAVFHALLALSDIATLEGRTDVAMQCLGFAKAYKRSARTQLRLANAAGFLNLQIGNGAAARAAFETGIRIAEQANLPATGEHRPLSFLGLAQAALLEKATETARRYAIQSLTFSSKRADVSQVVGALQVLARVLRASGNADAAVRMLRAAANLAEQLPIEELDATTRATYLATQHGVFAELTDLLVARVSKAGASGAATADADATWTAFNESERGHARSFRYALNQTTSDDPLTPHEPPAASYTQLVHRIADIAGADTRAKNLNPATQQFVEFAAESERRAAALNPAALTMQLDRAHAALIEYAAGRSDMYAFVIEGGSIHVVQLGDLKTIAAAAAALFERLHDPEAAAADIQRAAQRLARLALWPASRFVSRERVIFVPEDSLNTVPFAVLPWAQDAGSGLVVERVEVAIAPSALFLARHSDLSAAPAQAARFEFIGDPVFDMRSWQRDCLRGAATSGGLPVTATRSASEWAQSLSRLPGSRAEILALAELARAARPKSQIKMHLGCEATPAAVREAAATGAQLLHIATHGYIDALRPRLSALALSRDSATSPAAGVFGLLDILDLKLVSRLVVLSGCDTSRGRLLPGEGIVGPAQAFLQSGAASVLASAWRIDDAGTVAFMKSFYKHLLKEHLPAGAALRRAQLENLTSGNAYTWAAFALYGWPDSSF